MLLEDPDDGIFCVFFDDNQAIYRPPGGLPEEMPRARLQEDWRNTRPIFDAVMAFYRGASVVCAGPDGPAVEVLSVAEDQIPAELSRVLRRLVIEGDVTASDVVVLSPHAAAHSKVASRLGSFTLTDTPSGKKDVKLASIYRFKGLDAKVAILCEVNRFVEGLFTRRLALRR